MTTRATRRSSYISSASASTNSIPAPLATTTPASRTGSSSLHQNNKLPNTPESPYGPGASVPPSVNPDESIPEAALHLLRLSLPSASSIATNTTLGDDLDEADEKESDATSIMSDDYKFTTDPAFMRYPFAPGGPPGWSAQDYPYFGMPQGGPLPPYGPPFAPPPPGQYLYAPPPPPHSVGSQSRRTSIGSSSAMSQVGTVGSAATGGRGAPPHEGEGFESGGISQAGLRRHQQQQQAHQQQQQQQQQQASTTAGGRSLRVRQHRPARTQRAQSTASAASNRSRGGGGGHGMHDSSSSLMDGSDDMDEDYEDESTKKASRSNAGKSRAMTPSTSNSTAGGSKRANANNDDIVSDSDGDTFLPPPKRRAVASGSASRGGPSRPSTTTVPSAASAAASRPAARRGQRPQLPPNVTNREFPAGQQIDGAFPRLYRTFPISSAMDTYHPACWPMRTYDDTVSPDDTQCLADRSTVQLLAPPEGAKYNKINDIMSLYTPRFTKGVADEKVGVCPICVEPVERGGEGEWKWLKLKNSSYVYHMSFAHGISNLTGLPFSPPIELRVVSVKKETKDGRSEMKEGLCHKCDKWVPMLSTKNIEMTIPELIWWKHAKSCHGTTRIEGEGSFYTRDAVFDLVQDARARTSKVRVDA